MCEFDLESDGARRTGCLGGAWLVREVVSVSLAASGCLPGQHGGRQSAKPSWGDRVRNPGGPRRGSTGRRERAGG